MKTVNVDSSVHPAAVVLGNHFDAEMDKVLKLPGDPGQCAAHFAELALSKRNCPKAEAKLAYLEQLREEFAEEHGTSW